MSCEDLMDPDMGLCTQQAHIVMGRKKRSTNSSRGRSSSKPAGDMTAIREQWLTSAANVIAAWKEHQQQQEQEQ